MSYHAKQYNAGRPACQICLTSHSLCIPVLQAVGGELLYIGMVCVNPFYTNSDHNPKHKNEHDKNKKTELTLLC